MNKLYSITSLQHPLVKHLVKLRGDADYRYEHQSIVIEGIKPILEMAPHLKKLICTEATQSLGVSAPEQWIVSKAIMGKISGMTSTEGLVAEVAMPPFSTLEGLKLILACDGINDPGNLGTVLRTALALGWEGVYLLPNSCDPYNEKVIRAARGAHFRLPLAKGTIEGLKKLVQKNQLDPLVADLEGTYPEQLQTKRGRLLVLGNEAHGSSEEIYRFCSKVTIPMSGQMESLNVGIAGGILMYLLKKVDENGI